MTVGIRTALERHIQQKADNQQWLYECLAGETDAFPFRPDENGKPELSTPFRPAAISTARVTPPDEPSPLFVANIPMRRLPSEPLDYTKYSALFEKIRDESFGTTSTESAATIKDRVAVVLGINQIESIDKSLNRRFKTYIRNLPLVNDVVSRTIGFFWKPKWTTTQRSAYPLNKAFQIVKAISPEKAEDIRKEHEQPRGLADSIVSQVPFQKIREAIKNSNGTRTFLSQMEEDSPDSPLYFTLMDADSLSFRSAATQEGIFSRLDKLIADHEQPSIASLGYSLDQNERPLLRLAVKMDMAVRSTMPKPYFPEPFTAFKIRVPQTPNFLRSISFLGAGTALESRRFTQNGLKKLKDGAVFQGDGGVVTATPSRMKTIYNQSVQALTPAVLKKKQSLQALRGRTLQTHAFPKQWADILYAGLPFSCPQVTDATAPMMHIFSVYDPISRMFASLQRYTPAVFDQVMANYANPLSDAQTNLINTARARLLNLGMKKEMIDLVQETARRSGAAIHQILHEAAQ